MPRPRTGHAFYSESKGCWIALITLNSGKREPQPMRHIKREDEAGAKAFAATLSKIAKERGLVTVDTGETCEEYFDRWERARKDAGIRSTGDDRSRWKNWLSPHLSTSPIAEVQPRDLEKIVHSLDRDVRAGKLSWKSAIHVWTIVTKMFDDCTRAKDLSLRARADNPAKSVRGPDRGNDKASTFLFPNELLQLLAAPRIPVERKKLYTLAVYLGARAGELRALTWDDVNLQAGYVHIHRAHDRKRKEMKSTKTGSTRRVAIEPTLRPLLEAMHEESGGKGNVLRMPLWDLPEILRADLREAGCERAELYASDATRRPLDFHDCRHTYGTWRAIRGDDVVKIRFAMGHADLATTQRYINEAHVFDVATFGDVFPPLPTISSGSVSTSRKSLMSKWPLRDSKAKPDSAEITQKPAETRTETTPEPNASQTKPNAHTLRAALDRAILAEEWDAVKIIGVRLRELERPANVVELARGKR